MLPDGIDSNHLALNTDINGLNKNSSNCLKIELKG